MVVILKFYNFIIACGYSSKLHEGALKKEKLYVNIVPAKTTAKLGITILPGRSDWGRNLEYDLKSLRDLNIKKIVCMCTINDLNERGIDQLEILKMLKSTK